MMPNHRPARARIALFLCAAVPGALVCAPAAAQDVTPPPSTPALQAIEGADAPILPLQDVRVGMKGYGLTVFHGTEIEPFPVEVVSVISDFNPKRGTVWIRCDHPVLNVTGPVQGMSGSPIYLWTEGENQALGEGGKLIGAFAYGYGMVKECLAGVQPIELMRAVADDVDHDPGSAPVTPAAATEAVGLAHRLQALATAKNIPAAQRFRLDAMTHLLEQISGRDSKTKGDSAFLPAPPPGLDGGGVSRLMLPLSVGSPLAAEWASPLLESVGLAPVAGGIAGAPPPGIDADAARFEPGSVLSIPLAFGDTDLSAAGTVTEVRPDGTVLGFGHAMFGQGDIALPMATGYVHFFVPRITISFKQSGSLQLRGSLVQDQNVAVAGIAETRYKLAPAHITIDMPGYHEEFNYQVVNHPRLTPTIAAILTLQSLTASREFPIEHTLHMDTDIQFSGGRELAFRSVLPGGGAEAALMDVLPPLLILTNNPYENLELSSLRVTARVEPLLRTTTLVNGRLEKAEVAPGEIVRLTATVQPYGKAPQLLHAELRVPLGLPEGDYPLVLMDSASFASQVLMARPHLQSSATVDDVLDTLRRITEVRSDAAYLVLQMPDGGGLAVARSELPRLPSSRRAIIATPTSTIATPYAETAHAVIPTEGVIRGQLGFQLSVRQPTRAQLQRTESKP